MLRVVNVSKSFSESGFRLQDISFDIPAGYICGIIGENGAGKTTLINVISGIYKSDSYQAGKIIINGYDLLDDERNAKNSIGVILAECLFDQSFTLEQIGLLYGEFYENYNHESYLSYLSKFKLEPGSKLKTLSKGMAIKVQLAFAISHDAKLLIFDEPTAGLDKKFREEFLKLCMELVEDGTRSILISSHITEDFDRIADYIAYLQDGELLLFDSKESLTDKFRLLIGEKYKCKLINKEKLVCIEEKEYATNALVINRGQFPDELEEKIPSIRELMYYFVKGGHGHAKDICKRIYK